MLVSSTISKMNYKTNNLELESLMIIDSDRALSRMLNDFSKYKEYFKFIISRTNDLTAKDIFNKLTKICQIYIDTKYHNIYNIYSENDETILYFNLNFPDFKTMTYYNMFVSTIINDFNIWYGTKIATATIDDNIEIDGKKYTMRIDINPENILPFNGTKYLQDSLLKKSIE